MAISNHRLQKIDSKQVNFRYKDYRNSSQNKLMEVSGVEFLRRFVQHILPHGFVRIRHYGFLASKNKSKELNRAKADLNQSIPIAIGRERQKYSLEQICEERLGIKANECPSCHGQTLKIIRTLEPERGPPARVKPNLKRWEAMKN